jgi:hypothetical protein
MKGQRTAQKDTNKNAQAKEEIFHGVIHWKTQPGENEQVQGGKRKPKT